MNDDWVRITFDNPITKKVDYILIRREVLDHLRQESKTGVVAVSYFITIGEKSHLLTLHIDQNNNVRSRYPSSFFLVTSKKLYPSDEEFFLQSIPQ